MLKKKDLVRISDVPGIISELTGVTRCKETIYLWIKNGVKAYTGEPLRLKTTKRMGRLFTTRVWIEEFVRGI